MDKPVTATLLLPDVSGEHCVRPVSDAIGHLPSVSDVKVDAANRTVTFTYDPAKVRMVTIERALDAAGYPVSPDISKTDANATAEAGPQ